MPNSNLDSKEEKILKILSASTIKADTEIVCISVSKNLNSLKAFNNLLTRLSNPNGVMISSMSENTMTILIHEKFTENAKAAFSKDIQDVDNKVGAIFLECPNEVNKTPGITAFISSLFADKNISIYELIATYTDYVIVVNEKDVYTMAAYIKKVFESIKKDSNMNMVSRFLRNSRVKSVLKKSKVGATSNLVIFQIKKNAESLKTYDNVKMELMKSSNYIIGAVGERYISLVVNEQHYDYVLGNFEKHLVSVEKKAACIRVDCSKTDKVSGIINYITSNLSQNNINMYGFFTSQDDISILIDESNAFEYVAFLKKFLKV